VKEFWQKNWSRLSLLVFLPFLLFTVWWVKTIPPDSWQSVGGFLGLVFVDVFLLSLGISKRVKLALWLGLWLVLFLFWRYQRVGGTSFVLVSLVLWGLLKITP